jgi:hypothetical protein
MWGRDRDYETYCYAQSSTGVFSHLQEADVWLPIHKACVSGSDSTMSRALMDFARKFIGRSTAEKSAFSSSPVTATVS